MIAQRVGRLLELQHRRHRAERRRLVGQRRQELHRRREPDRRAPGMRHAFDAEGAGQRGDLAALREAAGGAEIGLHDVHRLLGDDVAKAPAREIVLAARHRHVERAGHLDIAVMVLRADRLLEPQDVVLLQHAAELDGVGHREAVVGVDRELDVGPDRLAHGADALGIELQVTQADLHLDGAKAVVLELQRLLHGLLDQPIHVDEVEAGGVGNDLAAIGAADQLVHRFADGAAHDVPQRDVDAGDGRDRHAGRAVVLDAIVEVLPDRLDVERVAADHARLVLGLDEGLGHRRRPVALAPAGDALVGRDLDHAGRARAVDPAARRDERLVDLALQDVAGDVGNLHCVLPKRYGLSACLQNQDALSTWLRSGCPAPKARQLSAMISNRRSSRYGPCPAMCGVSNTFGNAQSGCSLGSGSCS